MTMTGSIILTVKFYLSQVLRSSWRSKSRPVGFCLLYQTANGTGHKVLFQSLCVLIQKDPGALSSSPLKIMFSTAVLSQRESMALSLYSSLVPVGRSALPSATGVQWQWALNTVRNVDMHQTVSKSCRNPVLTWSKMFLIFFRKCSLE